MGLTPGVFTRLDTGLNHWRTRGSARIWLVRQAIGIRLLPDFSSAPLF